MDPSDLDGDDNGGLTFNDLPPSVRARMQAAAASPPQQQPQPQYIPQAPQAYMPQQPPQRPMPPPQAYAAYGAPIPIEQARQQVPVYQLAPAAAPGGTNGAPAAPEADKTPWLFLLATVVLGGVGWWAYSKMEKDRKIRVGPRRGYGDDAGDEGAGQDDGEPGGPLDEYEDAGLPEKDVDPHEDGGIKMVRG